MNFRVLLLFFFLFMTVSPNFDSIFPQERTQKTRLGPLSETPLINAYLTGNKSGLSSKLQKVHQDLNLQHLMTPSGLHLSSLILVLGFFIKGRSIKIGLLILLGLTSFPYAGIDSFKRMILFSVLRMNPLFSISTKKSFFMTFLISFLLGQYFENPLSFCLSFIFIGALIYSKNRIMTFLCLGLIQIILAQWFNKSFSFEGIALGFFFSLLSPIIFPLFLAESIFSSLPFSSLWSQLLFRAHDFITLSLTLKVSLLLPFIYFIDKKSLRKKALGLCLLLFALPLGKEVSPNKFHSPPPLAFQKKVSLKNGTKFIYDNGMRCYSRLDQDEWTHHCYK